jgi:hypothetical protein
MKKKQKPYLPSELYVNMKLVPITLISREYESIHKTLKKNISELERIIDDFGDEVDGLDRIVDFNEMLNKAYKQLEESSILRSTLLN